MKDWKIIVISASSAFMLSLLFGLLGSVSLDALLIRALSGAVIFGALGFCISILTRRYLPEVYELQTGSSPEIRNDLSEEDGQDSETGDPDDLSVSGMKIDISIDDGDESRTARMMPETDNGSAGGVEKENDLVDEISENDQVPANIDVLPDMGVFSDSFKGNVDDIVDGVNKTGSVTLDIMGEEQDPELVVRAVRTMVKKDQEG